MFAPYLGVCVRHILSLITSPIPTPLREEKSPLLAKKHTTGISSPCCHPLLRFYAKTLNGSSMQASSEKNLPSILLANRSPTLLCQKCHNNPRDVCSLAANQVLLQPLQATAKSIFLENEVHKYF